MENREKTGRSAGARRGILAAAVLAGIYLTVRYAAGIFMPFLIAWGVAASTVALSRGCEGRFGGKVRAWRIFWLAVMALFILVAISLAVKRIAAELWELIEYISSERESIAALIGRAVSRFTEWSARVPLIGDRGGIGEQVGEWADAFLAKIGERLGAALTDIAARVTGGAADMALSALATVMASVYLTLDYEKIRDYFGGLLTPRARARASELIGRIGQGIRGYIWAYARIFLLTFFELCAGLLMLGRRYAPAAAFFIALADLLPFFGAGGVLVVWSAVLFATGSYGTGAGMLVLAAVVIVVRQIAEPRILGKGLGIHPLASLAAIYVGTRLLGMWGVIFGPIAAVTVREIVKKGREDASP